ncbi:cephalosporin hydroxylase [Paenibacillus castaneae]|uniref:class I SAM-dependent methyltransferase n=1 Tax=Paenibacillus castaneae TaxID=474957 RepID=UPI000C9A01AA|nr:class I SAM-dependent methyltransferase [Paenibacillus castaneae]NIK79062.1 cephalosporin hydroxylase [Paenibacillus castaneae]
MKDTWHLDFIFQLASIVRPKVYVELGIQYCANFNRMIDYADQLIGIDIAHQAGEYMSKSGKVQFFHGTSADFAKRLQAQPLQIDMLFIDADHSKEAVLEDFRLLFPYVVPHGIVLFHDSHPDNESKVRPDWCGTVYQAIEELAKDTSEYELVTIPVTPGLTICRKRRQQLSWQEKQR